MTGVASERGIGIGVALSALLLFSSAWLVANSRLLKGADFKVPYTGGLIVRRGNAAKLYDLAEQRRVQEEFAAGVIFLLDPYPPFHALAFAPVTRLAYRTAYLAWSGINVLLWVAFYYLVRSRVAATMQPFSSLALCFLFFPVWVTMMQGQLSFILLLSISLAYLCLREHRDFAGGLALGVGLIKFQVAAPLALIFLFRRQWRFVAGLGMAAAALGLVSLMTVGGAGVWSYVSLLADTFRHPTNLVYSTIKPWNMPTVAGTVNGVLRGRVSTPWISVLSGGLSGCLILLMAWCWGTEKEDRDRFDLGFAAAVMVSLATAPYLQVHDLLPALLAVILVVASARWAEKSGERVILGAMIALLYACPLYLGALMGDGRLYLLAIVLLSFAATTLILRRGARARLGGTGTSRKAQVASVAAG